MRRRFVVLAFLVGMAVASCSRDAQSLHFSVIPHPSEVTLVGGGMI